MFFKWYFKPHTYTVIKTGENGSRIWMDESRVGSILLRAFSLIHTHLDELEEGTQEAGHRQR